MLSTVRAGASARSPADGGSCERECARQAEELAGRCRRMAAAAQTDGEPVRACLLDELAAALAELAG